MAVDARVQAVQARAYAVPTDLPEADGTASWELTTIVVVHAKAGGKTGLGYTYADAPVAGLVNQKLAAEAKGRDAMDPPGAWRAMQVAVRNLGRAGMAATAVSAVDVALWDLKAKLLDIPLASLLGRFRDDVPDLRQRRLHQLHRPPGGRTTRRVDRARRLPMGQDEDRQPSGA